MSLHTDTIAAIATPLGEGGIAIIRISGTDAVAVAGRCLDTSVPPEAALPNTVHVATMKDSGGKLLDKVLYTIFKAPRSYTGEDVLEISCHGGLLVSRRVLESVLRSGARHAAPGEFTKRAFLNGKIDLVQAEAVAELIHATSDKAHRTSLSHLQGEFSASVDTVREALMDALGLLELELDFAEDGYEFLDKDKVEALITEAMAKVEILIESYTVGRVIREGVNTVIVGAPNAGKSSLMNRLLRESRAIVTEVPGTTRDVISECIMIKGVLFKLSDTAGIRDSKDLVEKEGIRRSKEKLMTADVILLVLDSTRSVREQLKDIGQEAIQIIGRKTGKVQVAFNKVDLKEPPDEEPAIPGTIDKERISRISAKTGEGVLELEDALLRHVPGFEDATAPEGDIVTTARHYEAFRRVSGSLRLSLESLKSGQTGEFIAVDLRDALETLGEVVGKVTNEDILNGIFARFCIGK